MNLRLLIAKNCTSLTYEYTFMEHWCNFAKPFESISIRQWSDILAQHRCLIDVDPSVFDEVFALACRLGQQSITCDTFELQSLCVRRVCRVKRERERAVSGQKLRMIHCLPESTLVRCQGRLGFLTAPSAVRFCEISSSTSSDAVSTEKVTKNIDKERWRKRIILWSPLRLLMT